MAERLADATDASSAALAVSAFEENQIGVWYVDAYYETAPTPVAILTRIGDLLDPAGPPPSMEEVPDENWVAISQAALPPVASGRFLIHGSHDRALVGRRQVAIEIEAGEAFGTAHHATTQGCLKAIDRLAHRRSPRKVLDLGSGTGLLAIAAARVWPNATIVASDIDPIAIEVAQVNATLNGARNRIRFATAPGLDHQRLRAGAPYDLILANILAGPLIQLAPKLSRAIRPGGIAVLSGILGEQAREVIGSYAMAGFQLLRRDVSYNWATLIFNRNAQQRQYRRPLQNGG